MKVNKHVFAHTFGALGAALLLCADSAAFLAGCGTTSGYQQADKTGAGIAEFRDEIVIGKKASDATMIALGMVATTANTDPRKAFEQYSNDVANLDSTVSKMRKRAQEMRQDGVVQ